MKNCRIFALAAVLLAGVSCADKAQIKGVLADAPGSQMVVRVLDVNTYTTLDTVRTAKDGSFSYSLPVAKGQPEFVYLFRGDTRIAALLLEAGEKAVVKADTLGHYEVSGSEGSAMLKDVDARYAAFLGSIMADTGSSGRQYVNYYRECVKYVMANPKSLTVVPVLYQTVGDMPVFSQPSDAIFFRNVVDSLKTVYPESKYVKALEKEAVRRVQNMALNTRLQNAERVSFPDIVLPDMSGTPKALSTVGSKVIMVHFWDASDPVQKMLNVDAILPIYKDFHDKGLEVYSVCLTADKASWGSIVHSQQLPWINVNDGNGVLCPAVVTYNVTSLPTSFLIVDGTLRTDMNIKGVDGLRRELSKILK